MERVPADRGGGVLSCRCRVRLAHVHGHSGELGTAFLAEQLVELVEGVGVLAFADPHNVAFAVVDDDRQVLVVFRVGDLVDPDLSEPVEPCREQALGDDAGDDGRDGHPIDPQRGGHGGAVRSLRPPRHHVFELAGMAAGSSRPRHIFGHDSVACPAAQSADLTLQCDTDPERVEVPPPPLRSAMHHSCRPPTLASHQGPSVAYRQHYPAELAEVDVDHSEGGKGQHLVE